MSIELTSLLILGLSLLLLLVGAMLVIQPDKERNLIATLVVVDVAVLLTVIFPLHWLLGWVADEKLLLLWILGGLIIGGIAFLSKLNYLLAILVGAFVPMLILLAFGGLPDMEYGWGVYSLPLSVVGIALVYALKSAKKILAFYVLSWLFMLVFALFPYYMQELDSVLMPPTQNMMNIANYKIFLTAIYFVLNLTILLIPAFFERPRVVANRAYQP